MGRKERREREAKRENYASQRSSEKRRNTLIAVAVLAVIALIVGYAAFQFATMTETAPGGPENAGALGSEHSHTGILVKIFGDTFDFSSPSYQLKNRWIHFEGNDGTTIHKHATGVKLGYLFESLSIGLDNECFVFPNEKEYCNTDKYSLKFFINGEQVDNIVDYEPMDDDKVLISFGDETPEEIEGQLLELQAQQLVK
ncbi:MAG: protein-disulfide isomerase [Nitrosopumilus sp.]|nr:protein-disulfide isomerase [Nitrosopumilus sp.]MDH3384396.1 protein-disulfide isomerase [Nitrosopumilus sp.]